MDDLEFRRRAYAEPDCQEKTFVEHKNQSADNISFVDELQSLDETLKRAMQIQPPQDLAERIKLSQTLGHHQTVRRRWRYGSMAASILLVASLTFSYFPFTDKLTEQQLTADVLTHIYHELDHLHEQQNRSLAQVNTLLSDFGGNMTHSIGQVNYLGSCNIANKKGVHMVVQGDVGPITVMMLPAVSVPSQQLIKDLRFKGVIIPTKKGSMAIIGEKAEPLKSLQDKLAKHMRWI